MQHIANKTNLNHIKCWQHEFSRSVFSTESVLKVTSYILNNHTMNEQKYFLLISLALKKNSPIRKKYYKKSNKIIWYFCQKCISKINKINRQFKWVNHISHLLKHRGFFHTQTSDKGQHAHTDTLIRNTFTSLMPPRGF